MGENETEPRELDGGEWRSAGVEFAKDYCEAFEREASEWCEDHQVTIEFLELYSPKYYNYATDTIWIKVVSEFETSDDFRDSLEKWIAGYDSENKNCNFDCIMWEAMD